MSWWTTQRRITKNAKQWKSYGLYEKNQQGQKGTEEKFCNSAKFFAMSKQATPQLLQTPLHLV